SAPPAAPPRQTSNDDISPRDAIQPMLGGRPSPPPSAPPAPPAMPPNVPPAQVFTRPSAPPKAKSRGSLEMRIGGNWFQRIGVIAVTLGIAFFLKYAY